MNTILVWVLVTVSYVNSGVSVNISGDFAGVDDCLRVKKAVVDMQKDQRAGDWQSSQCVQVRKVVAK